MLNIIKKLHHKYVFMRRIEVISDEIAKQIPANISILDIGCGDGNIGKLIREKKEGVVLSGIDIMERPACYIPYKNFDGLNIPYPNNAFDAVLFVDVLHHTHQITELMKNAVSASSKYVIIKDHMYKTPLDFAILKFMDWVGNAPHGVEIIYNFKKEEYWLKLFKELDLEVIHLNRKIPLYPLLFNFIFGRKLHFITLLKKKNY